MCIPPPEPGRWFEDLAELAAEGQRQGLPLTELSMGMSADFEQAIALGAPEISILATSLAESTENYLQN